MPQNIRLWSRDKEIITEVTRSPLCTSHIARLHEFPSRKKAAERLLPLTMAGLVKRIAHYHPAKQGKPEFVYYTGARPHPRTLTHTIGIAEARVQLAEWLRKQDEYSASFLYARETSTSHGIIPDAAIPFQKGERTALVFVEIDNGTEPVTSATGYSLSKKLCSYASYFDSAAYQADFGWTGPLHGFRVALVVPPARLRHVQHVIAQERHDFVLVTTSAQFQHGFDQSIWLAHNGTPMTLLGRPGDLRGEHRGEMVGPLIPTTAQRNA